MCHHAGVPRDSLITVYNQLASVVARHALHTLVHKELAMRIKTIFHTVDNCTYSRSVLLTWCATQCHNKYTSQI